MTGFSCATFLVLLAASRVMGCMCAGSSSVCDSFASADVVFIGKVESKNPSFDPDGPVFSERLGKLFQGGDLAGALRDNSPGTLAKIKAFYAAVLPEPDRSAVMRSANKEQLESAIDQIAADGQRVTFRIDQGYKGIRKVAQSLDVWSEYTDCGIRFAQGETYVVYAWRAHDGLRTGACSRTRRISEAGDDLVYPHFMQRGGPDIGRIWGFVSGDERAPNLPHIFDFVPLPISYLNVQLYASERTLQAWTDQKRQYAFDGLPAGDYEVAIKEQTRNVHLEPTACKSEWFYVPKDQSSK